MELLDRFWRSRGFTLPQFELTPLEFDQPAGEASGELFLDELVADTGPKTSAATSVRPMPTAGELHASIERHSGTARQGAPLDPAEELRSALSELRRSLA